MSGSSLDGLDLAICDFWVTDSGLWEGQIVQGKTVPIPQSLEIKLRNLPNGTALELAEVDARFAEFSADCVNQMLKESHVQPQAIASHGHTIFHQPASGFTTQIGNGGILAAKTGLPVVCDFRSSDVGLGGQGAPLVPGAEQFLFGNYEACLNLGGIANISFPKSESGQGFDISPCNQLLNLAAGWLGLTFDPQGENAGQGTLIPELMDALNRIPFYKINPPKSLGNEDVAQVWKPLLEQFSNRPKDVLNTLSQHIAIQMAQSIQASGSGGTILVTGGGGYNSFLLECLKLNLSNGWQIQLPSDQMMQFKEAYCFAFLGLKRWRGEINCFARITGASKDSIIGAIYL